MWFNLYRFNKEGEGNRTFCTHFVLETFSSMLTCRNVLYWISQANNSHLMVVILGAPLTAQTYLIKRMEHSYIVLYPLSLYAFFCSASPLSTVVCIGFQSACWLIIHENILTASELSGQVSCSLLSAWSCIIYLSQHILCFYSKQTNKYTGRKITDDIQVRFRLFICILLVNAVKRQDIHCDRRFKEHRKQTNP